MPTKRSTINQVHNLIPFFQHEDAADDKKIDQYFIVTRYYQEIPIDGSVVIVGRYGSGKTAFLQDLVKKRRKQLTHLYVVPISLKVDMFVEELREVKKSQDYATFCCALVYLHVLYSIAEDARGTLTTGEKAKLIQELKSLKLQPYGDIISNIAGAAWRTLRSVKKLSIKEVFGIEFRDEKKAEINMRRYRELCLKIEPIIRRLIEKRKTLIVVDALDATAPIAEETAYLVGSLIAWLLQEQRKTLRALQFLVGLPTNLLWVYRTQGGHIPAQDVFVKIEWDEDELEQLVLDRLKAALGEDIDAKKWLSRTIGVDLSKTHAYTFGRPRDYIKLIRKCLLVKEKYHKISTSECWKQGLQHYSEETLGWLQSEWQLALKGFEELTALLKSLPKTFNEKDLRDGIEDIRKGGHLETYATNSIVEDLRKWRLIVDLDKKIGKKKFGSHPILRTEIYLS